MKDDSGEKQRRKLIPRIALLACLAPVVLSLGIALSPGSPEEPAEPPFSEQARSAALAETMGLRAAGEELAASASGDAKPAVAQTVSLLTSQARALLLPGQDDPASLLPPGPATPSTAPSAGQSASASAGQSAAPLPSSAAALATELADSAAQRLADAAVTDGGMARLLSSVGTAQLLQASSLAAAAGSPAPAVPDPAAPQLSGACPSAAASPSSSPADASGPSSSPDASGPSSSPADASTASAGADGGAATLPGALAAAVRTELETVYGYQVALTRLNGEAAALASEQLARHEALAAGAEALSRVHCAPVPPREAGYTMEQDFLASPAAGLGRLEASALPVYGDLVALSEGQTRQWAIAGLVGAARRSALWGAGAGVLPGLAADPAGFPELPTPSP
ncbi:ferritin-like domain-containing protein [Pseudarthrobacter sp. PvP090]|uniref:ferritin-like domain-containing protein n=1 Tax=Pseudarthrobacter sp. PvP090 TaxID=3156393 RepID=UPI0033997094